MTEPIDQATKLPPLPWVYTEDKREEMFSIHTEGQDPIDCDNRFIVCGIWYQSCGRKHGKAIADFIIDSANTTWAERLKQERNKTIDECIELFPFNETNPLWQWQIKQKLASLKDKSHE